MPSTLKEVELSSVVLKTIQNFTCKFMKAYTSPSGLINFLEMAVINFKNIDEDILLKLFHSLYKCLLGEKMNKYKVITTKSNAYLLLAELVKRLHKLPEVITKLEAIHENTSWRTQKNSDWNISSDELKENTRGYVGLINMGATCYVNSIIQQLFMTPAFRNEVLEVKEKMKPGTPFSELQCVMGILYQKQLMNFKAKKFYDSMNIDVHVQRDASEFLTNLFEEINENLRLTNKSHSIKNLFEITTVTTITCSNCNEVRKIPATTLMLGLAVKGNKSVTEGLESFIRPETLKDDNAYSCGRCKKKVSAIKQEQIESLPNLLIINLKRFELVYGSHNKKLNSFYEFQLLLDMQKYTSIKHSNSKDYYLYKLKGVVVHIGTLNAGHYYSLIRSSEDNSWIKFDDTTIEPFDVNNLPDETFGKELEGIEENTRNAYLLLYEKETFSKNESIKEINLKTMSEVVIRPSLKARLLEEYKDFMERQLVFTPGYDTFIINLISNGKNSTTDKESYVYEFGFKYLLTSLLRSCMRDSIFEVTKIIEECCMVNTKLALNVVDAFTSSDILREFILDCPKDEARLCTYAILKASIDCVYKVTSFDAFMKEKSTTDVPSLIYLMNTLLQQFNYVNKSICGEYFRIMSELIKPKLIYFMKKDVLIGKIILLLDITLETDWSKCKTPTIVEGDNKKHSFIPISKNCSLIPEKNLDETSAVKQFPHIINFLTQLIKAYASLPEVKRPLDFIETQVLVKEENIKVLCGLGSRTKEGKEAIAELINTLARLSEANMFNILYKAFIKLDEFSTKELPTALKTIEILLKEANNNMFKVVIDLFRKVFSTVMKNHREEYFTVISYIDCFFKILAIYRKKFEVLTDYFRDEESKSLLNMIESWIKEDVNPEKVKLFSDSKEPLAIEDASIVSVSSKARKERKDLVDRLMRKELEDWNEYEFEGKRSLESIKVEDNIDIYMSKEKRWKKAKVRDKSQLALKVKTDNEELWIERNLENVSPENTRLKNVRSQEKDLLLNIYFN